MYVWKGRLFLLCMMAHAVDSGQLAMNRQRLRDAVFAKNGLEYGRERAGAGASAARAGGTADCRPDGLESDALRLHYDADLLAALTDPRALDYDPQPWGSARAGGGVRLLCRSWRGGFDPEQVVLTTSTSEAYSFLFRLLCDPGSEILVPQPGYPLFDFLAVLDDVRIKAAPLVYDHGWQIEPEGFRRAITPETRAIVLVHPNNPTGHFTKPWEAEELARVPRIRNLSLIVDEVFLDYGFGGAEAASFAAGLEGVPVLRGQRPEQDRRTAADEGGMDCRDRAEVPRLRWTGWR